MSDPSERHPARISLVILGTSSGQPTLDRGLSAIALVREGEIWLLDCGEGAQMRFRQAGLRFGRVAGVLITHLHGDHVTGLPGLLMSLQMAGREAPLRVVGPHGLRAFVLEISRMIYTGYGYPMEFVELDGAARVVTAADYDIDAVPLEHRVPAVGYCLREHDFPGRFHVEQAQGLGVVEGSDYGRLQRGECVTNREGRLVRPEEVLGPPRRGKRVAYCTDTRPCEGGVTLARSADVLIHEATFLSDRLDEAVISGHSTAGEAAQVATQAGAHRLLITHFSPRYVDVAPLLDEARAIFPATEAAHDLQVYAV